MTHADEESSLLRDLVELLNSRLGGSPRIVLEDRERTYYLSCHEAGSLDLRVCPKNEPHDGQLFHFANIPIGEITWLSATVVDRPSSDNPALRVLHLSRLALSNNFRTDTAQGERSLRRRLAVWRELIALLKGAKEENAIDTHS